jgi:hypothetical protein
MSPTIRHRLSEGFALEAIAIEFQITTDSVILGLLSDGLSPSQIAKKSGISTSLLIQQICMAIGAGRLLRSEIYATLKKDWLSDIAIWPQSRAFTPEFLHENLVAGNVDCDLDVDDVKFYSLFVGKSFLPVETYEMLFEIEVNLHTKIKELLQEHYGRSETGWWTKGIPEKVRAACAKRREENNEFAKEAPYDYMMLMDLREIFEKSWPAFVKRLPSIIAHKKPGFLEDLKSLNRIRNIVMHPVKSSQLTEDDFNFVKEMWLKLNLKNWRKK